MAQVHTMMRSHPNPGNIDGEALASCVEGCFECAQACTACADACLAEDMVADLRRCIRTDLDCADICAATGAVLSRQTEPTQDMIRRQVEALATACKTCAAECEQHASMHEHCKVCGDACRRCEQACERLLQAVAA